MSPAPAAAARRPWLPALLALGLALGLALALRAPPLQLVPHLTDETGEVLFAYDIAFGGARPLTHTDAYNGPFWPYLLALALRLFGASATLPRAFALALALPVVALSFALAWGLARPAARLGAATVAGLFMATSFTHALVNSRVAWSNASTPLWTTLTALALLAACRRRSRPLLVAAGLLGGLALHTHPSVSVFLAALALWFPLDAERRAWLRSPWPWLAAAAALVAYSPVIAFNLGHGFATLSEAAASRNFATDSGVPWPLGVARLLAQLGRSLAGGFGPDGPDPAWAPVSWLVAGMALVAVLWLARDRAGLVGRRLPLLVLGLAVLALPLFNANWWGLLEARYLGYTWPFLYAAMGVVAAEAWVVAGRPGRLVLALAALALVALPALRLWRHDARALAEQFDNRRLWAMLAAIEAAPTGEPVLVDEDLKATPWRAGGHPRRALEYLFTMDGVPFDRVPEDKMNALLAAGGDYWLALDGATAERLSAAHRLRPVDLATRPGEGAWGLYRAGE